MEQKPTVIELFAGAGGLALGLEKAGFKTIALVENNRFASQTLLKNRPNWNVINEDIEKVAQKGIRNYIDVVDIDLLSGGYPCQSFSYAGNRLGLADTRGTLFYYYAEILKELQPKMFLAENVKGLLSHDKGRTLKTMIEVFQDVGYRVQYKVLNAFDYGVAQKRERIFIIGIRNDFFKGEFQFPKPLKKKLVLKDVLKNCPPSPCATYSEKKREILKLVPAGGYWKDLPENIAKEYLGKSYYSNGGKTGVARRLSWNEPSLTILCSPSQKQTERCHPDEVRPLSIRESARIQSFPDSWEFVGSISEQYKQIGNAVPVELAKHVGLAIKSYLKKRRHYGQLQLEFY
ncbi:MAG TPA: DNA (cytosine-5-)-methyltransferase [Campylobacterales bacterium]|nr:DNA (cytosine-5-)-methyltransferase [Campylobacterales bacterium]HIO70615.1 DNA (cytosine-5-)-methyltransferase [Campylobacterales bacterium]